jgi:hypothetical protein
MKRSFGKSTPIRILKCPCVDFSSFSMTNENITDLVRVRFNEKIPSIGKKPIRETTYLTFKQKRYNQRNNIAVKKQQTLINNDKKSIFLYNNKEKKQYSGNPFLKNLSLIEENYSNPTKQYRMLKKAKSRLDTTKVST